METLDFCHADLTGCGFHDAVRENPESQCESQIVDARFEGANLRGADIGDLRLHDARRH
ncbi:MAG: pentapeptide repeat-containing protein [Brevundimonas sp.]